MSEKMRVHILAKELNVSSQAIIDKCKAEGVDVVKNHMSTLSAGLHATIREWFSEGGHENTIETAERVNLDKVRVNCLSPGPFPSEKASKEMVERLCTKLPMKRMGLPYELKGALVFLASDASSYMTGHNLTIDGGWTAW